MKKSTIIKDLIAMLESGLTELKYVGKDWGQLDYEQPPVGWPCVLIDIEEVAVFRYTDGNELDTATVVLTVANKRTNSSSSHAPAGTLAKSMATIDLTDDIHGKVQGYKASGADYNALQAVSFFKRRDIPGVECYEMRYRTKYNTNTTQTNTTQQ